MRTILVVAVLAVSLGLGAASVAETGAEDAAKYRQYVMRGLNSHSGTIGLIAQGKGGNPANIDIHMQALRTFTAELASVFPKGSNIEGSESLPLIWEQPEEFAEAIATFDAAVKKLGKKVIDGDSKAIAAAQKEVGKTCSGCHDKFRLDD